MSKKDVEAGEKQWLAAFNGGDAAVVASKYEENARLMPPNMPILQGRGQIEPFVKEFVATGAQLRFGQLTIHETPDLCISVGTYQMDIPVPGGEAQRDDGKFVEVWRKQADGSWQIADDIFNSDLPAPPA
jgi:ketosteroid isomerase-like protein